MRADVGMRVEQPSEPACDEPAIGALSRESTFRSVARPATSSRRNAVRQAQPRRYVKRSPRSCARCRPR